MVASNHSRTTSNLSRHCKACGYSTPEPLAGFWDEKPDPAPLARVRTLKGLVEKFCTLLFDEIDEQRALAKVRKAQSKILPDNPDALICPRCYDISEEEEPKEQGRALKFVIFSALSLPFLQTLIWYVGITFSNDLRYQFAMPGIDDGIFFTFVFGGGAQFFFAALLGGLVCFVSLSPSRTYRRLLLMEGLIGCLCFGLILKNNWNFESNHCTPDDGCVLTSPFTFDFVYCVFFGLPLLWCFALTCTALFTCIPSATRQAN